MMPFQIRIERRLERKWWYSVLTPVLSVFAALLGAAIFLGIEGFDPIRVYREIFEASFTTRFGFTYSVTIAIPLILTGLAAAIVFRMNLFNIGAEGQLYFGAIFGSWAALALTDGM